MQFSTSLVIHLKQSLLMDEVPNYARSVDPDKPQQSYFQMKKEFNDASTERPMFERPLAIVSSTPEGRRKRKWSIEPQN